MNWSKKTFTRDSFFYRIWAGRFDKSLHPCSSQFPTSLCHTHLPRASSIDSNEVMTKSKNTSASTKAAYSEAANHAEDAKAMTEKDDLPKVEEKLV